MKHIIAFIALFLSMAFIGNIVKAETVSIEIIYSCMMKIKDNEKFIEVEYQIGKDANDYYYVFDHKNKILLPPNDLEFSKSFGKNTIIVSSLMTEEVLIRLTHCNKI